MSDLRFSLNMVNSNAAKLQGQYQLKLGGGELTCNEFFDALTPYTLSSNNVRDYPDLAEIATAINQAQMDFIAAKQTYDQVCDNNQQIDAGEFGAPMAMVVTMVQQLSEASDALTAAEAMSDADNTLAPPVEAPTLETDTTSTLNADIRSHITPLQTIVDDMTATRGAYTLLAEYWSEAANGGTTGCQDTVPVIPDDYVLPEDLAASAPNLKLSADLVNTGLQLVRSGWAQFTASCADTTEAMGAIAPSWVTNMNNAGIAFETASTQLSNLRAGS